MPTVQMDKCRHSDSYLLLMMHNTCSIHYNLLENQLSRWENPNLQVVILNYFRIILCREGCLIRLRPYKLLNRLVYKDMLKNICFYGYSEHVKFHGTKLLLNFPFITTQRTYT